MSRKAFSLIELLIVIVIIGVVYTLSIGNITKVSEKSFKLSLGNLKEYMQSLEYTSSVKILCLDDCSECDIFVDDEKQNTFEDLLDETVSIYRYETSYGYTQASKEVYFNQEDIEQDVCFSYEIDKSGVGNQVLVEFKDNFYDFSSYFTSALVYSSMDEALDAKENLVQEVVQ